MARTITPSQRAILNGSASGIFAYLIQINHPLGIERWSSLPFDWTDANTTEWQGGAHVLEFGQAISLQGIAAGKMTLTLNSADDTLINWARNDGLQGAAATQYLAFIDDAGQQVDDLVIVFRGSCDKPEIRLDPQRPAIAIPLENRLVRLQRANPHRLTPEGQGQYFPGDKGFDYVAAIQNKDPFGK